MDFFKKYNIWGESPNYKSFINIVFSLKKHYPFLNVIEIGKSVLGKSIYALQLGQWNEKVLFVGGVNGNDYSTTVLLLSFISRLSKAMDEGLCLSEVDILRAFLGRCLVVVPCINPDGCEMAIESGDSCNIMYEKSTLEQLCNEISFKHILQLEIGAPTIKYKYGLSTPTNATLMGQILSAISAIPLVTASQKQNDKSFPYWFTNSFARPAFTVSIGNKTPIPKSITPYLYDSIEELLTIAAIL